MKFDKQAAKHALLALVATAIFSTLGLALHAIGVCFFHVSGSECEASLAHGSIMGAAFCIGYYLGLCVARSEYEGTFPDNYTIKWYRGFYMKYWTQANRNTFIYSASTSVVFAIIAQFF